MSAQSSIEWTDRTWNPVTGCTKVSAGCKNCYAETIAKRFWKGRKFTNVRCHEDRIDDPLKWRKPCRIFVNSMSDLFHEDVPYDFIVRVLDVMHEARRHTFQVLTKRSQRMIEVMRAYTCAAPQNLPPNLWLGVSVENQAAADERIPILLKAPAAVRFLSCEPILGELHLSQWLESELDRYCRDDCFGIPVNANRAKVDWVIVGGESGPGARPCDVEWIRSIVKQCKAAGIPVFVKQLGANIIAGNPCDPIDQFPNDALPRFSQGPDEFTAQLHLRDRKGGNPAEWPADLRVREFPKVRS